MMDMMPLQESTILPVAEDSGATSFDDNMNHPIDDGDEEQKESDEATEHNLTSATFCEDLEKLLETGYAELIRTGMGGDYDENALADVDVIEETPFPKGLAVYDDDEGENGSDSPVSNDEEFENGYEVICARDIDQIPAY